VVDREIESSRDKARQLRLEGPEESNLKNKKNEVL
jgi:hypothetical protein